MREMAKRPLVEWPDGSYSYEDLDYTPKEGARVIVGYFIAIVAVLAFLLILSLPGQS